MFNNIIANDRGVVGVDAFLTGGGDPRGGGIGDGRHQAKRSKNNKDKSENKNENKNNNNNIADERRVGGIDASFISGGGDLRGRGVGDGRHHANRSNNNNNRNNTNDSSSSSSIADDRRVASVALMRLSSETKYRKSEIGG